MDPNLKTIMQAIRQSDDSDKLPLNDQYLTKSVMSSQPRWGSYSGFSEMDSASIGGYLPSVSEQLEVLRNCVIIDHGQISQPISKHAVSPNHGKEINVLWKVPDLPKILLENLTIYPEIEELSSEDPGFNYVLINILNIIYNGLIQTGKGYSVDVRLGTDSQDPSDRHSDIIVKVYDENYKYILDLWDGVGSEIGKYLESLKDIGFASSEADKLYDFINVIFNPTPKHDCRK
jgi:hypothetical protein